MKAAQKAFSLLEMLVVIGIIAIIIGMGTVSYSTAQKKARDSKRKADVKSIQSALEQYYSLCTYVYPTQTTLTSIIATCITPTVVLMNTTPLDPKTNQNYIYTTSVSDNTYSICVPTINASQPLETETSPGGTVTPYCLYNQQ